MTKRFYYDLETTGLNHKVNAIHQLSAIIEIDFKVKERINIYMKPFENAIIEPLSLEIGHVTEQVIQSYPEASKGLKTLLKVLRKHMKKPYTKDRFTLTGFCNNHFDDKFLEDFFQRHDVKSEKYFKGSEDIHPLTKKHFLKNFIMSDNLKLHSVAKALGIKIDSDKLHNSSYDVELTRNIHQTIIGAC